MALKRLTFARGEFMNLFTYLYKVTLERFHVIIFGPWLWHLMLACGDPELIMFMAIQNIN